MAPCRAASARQIDLLLEFSEGHTNLALGGLVGGPLGRQVALKKWEELSRRLNSVGTGCKKSSTEWKRYWTLLKSRTKCKAGAVRRAASGTGGGPNHMTPLTPIEERIIGIIGKVAVEGEPEAQISINIPDLPDVTNQKCPSPIAEVVIEEQAGNNNSTDNIIKESPQRQACDKEKHVEGLHVSPVLEVSHPPKVSNTRSRSRPLRSVENTPQWAVNIENKRLENQKEIVREMKGIKEAIQAQTDAMNRIANILSALVEKPNP